MVSNRPPLVSIITPAYNAERFLQATIDSVSTQTFTDYEHIIVDDCSTDSTPAIIAAASVDHRIRAHRNPQNSGVAAARNAGLELARGSLICFLDSDDRWTQEKLARQVKFMQTTGVEISYMDYLRTNLAGEPIGKVTPPLQVSFSELLKSNFIGNLTAMASSKAVGSTRFRRIGHEDYVFWLDVLKKTPIARKVPSEEALCLYRVVENSLSGNKLRAASWQWQIYRNVVGLGLAKSAWLFGNYLARGVLKRAS